MNNSEKEQRFKNLTGIVTLRTVWSKEQKLHLDPVYDPITQWYKGVDRLSNAQKEKMNFHVDENSTIELHNGINFNLNERVGRMQWDWVQWTVAIAEDFEACQKTPGAMFYIDNEEREAQTGLTESEAILKAMNYVQTDKSANWKSRIRLLGLNMDEDPDLTVKNYLMNMARKIESAYKVIDVYENNELGVQLLYLQAMDKNIIIKKNGAYLFGDTVLGISDESVLGFLKDPNNSIIIEQINKETNPEHYKKD